LAFTGKEEFAWTWVKRLLKELKRESFTGSIRINFFKGDISKKIEKTSFISEK